MEEFRWLGRFEEGAVGAVITAPIPVPPEPRAYLMLQDEGGSAAFFIGFRHPGVLEVNRQQDDRWQTPSFLPLPSPGKGTLRLVLRVAEDYVVLVLGDRPFGVFPLGAAAHRVRALCGFAISSRVRVEAGAPLNASFAALSRRAIMDLPETRAGASRAVVMTPYLVPAVADALGCHDEVVAVAPLTWHMAALALAFPSQIASGQLVPFAAMPASTNGQRHVAMRPDAPGLTSAGTGQEATLAAQPVEEVACGALVAALGPVAEVYRAPPDEEAGSVSQFLPQWAGTERTSVVAPLARAQVLIEIGCRWVGIDRAWLPGPRRPRLEHWIPASALPRLIEAAAKHPSDLVALGSARPASGSRQ
jgi:hypothetical protein